MTPNKILSSNVLYYPNIEFFDETWVKSTLCICEKIDCGRKKLLMFSCKIRGFCPSCHAKRREKWCEWMREKLILLQREVQINKAGSIRSQALMILCSAGFHP